MTWLEYVRSVMGEDNQKTAAQKTGVDQSTFSRWMSSGEPGRIENVVGFARSYGRPPLEALVAAGFISAAEARQRPAAAPSLDSISDDELVEEIRKRLREAGEGHGTGPAPIASAAEARAAKKKRVIEQALPADRAAYEGDKT